MAESDILAAPLADPAFGKLSSQDKVAAVQRILASKDKDFAKLAPAEQATASAKILESRGGASVKPPLVSSRGFKTLGRNLATTVAGTAPVMMGAETGAEIGTAIAPGVGTAIGGVAGAAFGGLAVPAAEYLTQHAMGETAARPTAKEVGQSAISNAEWSMIPGSAEQALIGNPLRTVERVLGIEGASELASKGAQGAAEAGAKLSEEKATIQAETKASRIKAGQSALQEHAETIAEAEGEVDKARAKLRESKVAAAEKARPDAAEQTAQGQAQSMVGKTPQQFNQEAAQPYTQRAAALSRATTPVFDASAKFHEEVGAKFEPYIGKIKDKPVVSSAIENMNDTLGGIQSTLQERGQRIESAELRQVIDGLKPPKVTFRLPDNTEWYGTEIGTIKDPQQRMKVEEQLISSGLAKPPSGEPGLTYGKLWGYRARANRVLASSKNPADRWAAREIIGNINDAIPGVPSEIRSQYAFERKMSRSVMGKVASARTPQEVGEAVFGSKANPEPAELPLQVFRFTKQYAPEQMDGLREAFADRFVGNKMDANDLAKMNHHVLTELYGDKADGVIRLMGPEGDVKMASWGQLIKTDPAARVNLESAIRDSATKQANLTQREALRAGQKALETRSEEHKFIKQKMDAVQTPQAKLEILAKEMPDIETARQNAIREGAAGGKLSGRFEGYLARRLQFMGLMAALGGYGMLSKRPGLVSAALAMGAGVGIRAGARAAIATESGSSLYMKALDMRPTPENA